MSNNNEMSVTCVDCKEKFKTKQFGAEHTGKVIERFKGHGWDLAPDGSWRCPKCKGPDLNQAELEDLAGEMPG